MHSTESDESIRWKLRGFVAGLFLLLIVLLYAREFRIKDNVTTMSANDQQPSIVISGGGPEWVAWTTVSAAKKTEEIMVHSMAALGVVEALQIAPLPIQATQEPFVTPEPLAPGTPTMKLFQLMNPTDDPVEAAIRPQYEKDAELCRALRMATVSMEKQSQMVVGGSFSEVAESVGPHLLLQPHELYNLALLVSVPMNLSNEYQGKSCQVDFMLEHTGMYQ